MRGDGDNPEGDFRLSDSQIIRLADGGETSVPLATGSIARGDFSTALEMTEGKRFEV